MTIIVTTEIVFDGHSEVGQSFDFEQANDMEKEWTKLEVGNCIVFKRTEETYCDQHRSYCPNCGQHL